MDHPAVPTVLVSHWPLDRRPTVLAGTAFGDDPRALRFRAATNMLYGATAEQQRETTRAADPLGVPHVAVALATIEKAFATLG